MILFKNYLALEQLNNGFNTTFIIVSHWFIQSQYIFFRA